MVADARTNTGDPDKVYENGASISNREIVEALPEPKTIEEQFLYAWACTLAGVTYDSPFPAPIYRKDQLLKAIWQITQNRMVTPTVIWDESVDSQNLCNGAVTTRTLAKNAVTSDNIADETVTTNNLSDGLVTTRKLADDSVTTEKIKDEAVDTTNLKDQAVTTDKLSDGSVTTKKLEDQAVVLATLATEVTERLLGKGETGVQQRPAVAKITESGDALTAAVLMTKINELIDLLKAAKITT